MNSIKNFGLKFAMIFVALLCANYAFAQDEIKASLKIENVSINNYDTKWIDICLDNETPVAALQFKFSLPEELEFADGENTEPELNYERLVKNNHVVALNVKNGMVVVQSLNLKDINGNEGWIMKLPVKVKEGMLATGKTVEIAVSKIEFTNGPGTVLSRQNEFPVYVSLDPFSYTGYLTPNPLAIYPAGTETVAFNLKNVFTDSEDEAPVLGLTYVMTLPEGLSVDEESIEINPERVFNRATVSYDATSGKFLLADLGQNKPLKTGFIDGPLFTFNLKAADGFVAKDAKIELSNLEVSAVVGAFAVEGVCEDCALSNTEDIVANKAAYDKVIETLDALQAKYDEALAEAKEANPDYDFSEYEEIISGAIAQAKEGAAQALGAANEDGEAFSFPFDGADIEAMIEEMKNAPAKAALENANQIAYDKVIETLDALDTKYAEALAAAEEANPDFDFSEYEEIITNAIKEAKEGAAQALAGANEEGEEFNFPFDGEEIENMIKEMENAPAKAVLEAANKAAYDKVIAALDKVQAQYEAALAQLKEEYPDYDLSEWEEIISGQINEQKEGAATALKVANDEGEEFNYPFDDGEYILGMIEEMKNNTALNIANLDAYKAVLTTLDALQTKYEDAVKAINETNPDFEVAEWGEIIMGAINEAREGAEQALESANEEGEAFKFAFDGSDIEAMIEELKSKSALQLANKAAYDKDIAALEEVEKAFDAAVAEIEKTYPDFDLTEWKEIIAGQINEQKEGAAIALKVANEDGEEYSYPFDGGEYLLAMVEEMKNSAKADADQAALEAANLEACDKVLEGLDALQNKYEAAVAEITESAPEFDLSEYEEIIMGAINQAREGAEQALASANEDGEEFNFPFDGEEIENMIAQMKEDAKTSAVSAIEAEVAAGKAYIFTLDGKQHQRPVSGEVNVIVRENSTSKIFIK